MKRDALLPAPGRGAYDRSLSRGERDARQRERLLLAASEVLGEGPLTVTRVVERAGVGRSTFYEFFDSPAHLLEQLSQRARRALDAHFQRALASADNQPQRVRALARAWLTELAARPLEARVALTPRTPTDLLSPAGSTLHDALSRWVGGADGASLLAAAAAVEAVTRRHLAGPALPDPERALVQILTRLLG